MHVIIIIIIIIIILKIIAEMIANNCWYRDLQYIPSNIADIQLYTATTTNTLNLHLYPAEIITGIIDSLFSQLIPNRLLYQTRPLRGASQGKWMSPTDHVTSNTVDVCESRRPIFRRMTSHAVELSRGRSRCVRRELIRVFASKRRPIERDRERPVYMHLHWSSLMPVSK